MDHVMRKGVVEHAQNAHIQIYIAHASSLIRAFALHWYILSWQMILLADGKGPDQTRGVFSRKLNFLLPEWFTLSKVATLFNLVYFQGNQIFFYRSVRFEQGGNTI